MRESAKARRLRLWKIRQAAEGYDVSDVHTLEDAERFFDEPKKKGNQTEEPKTTDEGNNEELEGKNLTPEETNEGKNESSEESTGNETAEKPTDETTGTTNENNTAPGNEGTDETNNETSGETPTDETTETSKEDTEEDETEKTNSGDGLEDVSYQDLKKMAKELGISQEGKKVELIERIRQHKEE